VLLYVASYITKSRLGSPKPSQFRYVAKPS
jgi:hypothetical protein